MIFGSVPLANECAEVTNWFAVDYYMFGRPEFRFADIRSIEVNGRRCLAVFNYYGVH